MRKSTRQVIAVMVVTTVLCADQLAQAAPASTSRTAAPSLARSLASRLTLNLGRAVKATGFEPVRRDGELKRVYSTSATSLAPVFHATNASPSRFRLPPPIL